MKAVVDEGSGQILDWAILGSGGGEIMTMIQVAMRGKLSYTTMADAIFTHPLLAEGLNALFAIFDASRDALVRARGNLNRKTDFDLAF
jgi:Pyridine nucleotide-disulphide oxidoreductase, dimerisation domain